MQTAQGFVWPQIGPKAWFDMFSTVVCALNFRPCDHDSIVFLLSTSIECTFLLLYVDDMIITGDDTVVISLLKSHYTTTLK